MGGGLAANWGVWHSEFSREKAWARIHLIPLLEAESDRDHVRRMMAADARERELMKDVKGWKYGSVYNSDRFVPLSIFCGLEFSIYLSGRGVRVVG